MTRRQALRRASEALAADQVDEARLEAELLLRHVLGLDRAGLYLELDRDLGAADEAAFRRLIQRRLHHEPSAYITGHHEFYGLDFLVTPAVLIPRPETELLVDRALAFAQEHLVSAVADIGTGSGAIAIALALNLPDIVVYATDISSAALTVAAENCRRHGVSRRVHLLQGDLLSPLPGPVDLIVANLPYVVESGVGALHPEPRVALDGGPDGLNKIRGLCAQVGDRLRGGGALLLEIGLGQGEEIAALLRRLFPSAAVEVSPDLRGIDRVIGLRLP